MFRSRKQHASETSPPQTQRSLPRSGGTQASVRDALGDPQFRRYNLSFGASALGFTSTIVVTGWLMYDLTARRSSSAR